MVKRLTKYFLKGAGLNCQKINKKEEMEKRILYDEQKQRDF